MTQPIHSSGVTPPVKPVAPVSPAAPQEQVTGKDFKTIMLESLQEVSRLQDEADQGVQRLLEGKTDNVAEVIAAANKSGIAFDLLMEVRNKLQDAYRDIQQMRI